jgi:hypothetical protein
MSIVADSVAYDSIINRLAQALEETSSSPLMGALEVGIDWRLITSLFYTDCASAGMKT